MTETLKLVQFIETDVDLLPPEALNYLKLAVDKTPGNETTVFKALSSGGKAFVIKNGPGILGAIYLEFYPDILNVVLLGVRNISENKSYIDKFVKKTMTEHKIHNLSVISRVGWHRIFKDLRPIGMIYSYSQGGYGSEGA